MSSGQQDGTRKAGRGHGSARRARRRVQLAGGPAAPGCARSFVQTTLASWRVPPETTEDALVVVSELVSNAVQHGTSHPVVELQRQEDRLLLRVGDQDPQPPTPQRHDPTAHRGRGLLIVEAFAMRWGHSPHAAGKWVWAEFALDAHVGVEGERV